MNLAAFLAKWSPTGGAERANKDSFLADFCDVIGVPHPDPTTGDGPRDAYVFERDAKLVPFDLEVVGRTPFDPTQYQSTLFVAASEDALLSTLTEWLEIESRG